METAADGEKKDDDGDHKAALEEERMRHAKNEADWDASWSKRVQAGGTGELAWMGALATFHLVGRLGSAYGDVFDDSRARGMPFMLLLGRQAVVPGLDRALLAMRAGERAHISVEPQGGYGAAGNIQYPRIPGSTTLWYDVEMLSLEKEGDLWDLTFEAKTRMANVRRERGNALFRGGHFKEADEEYEQAMRYLYFMPHVSEEEGETVQQRVATLNLNLAASKLRCGFEASAITHAEKVLESCAEHPKALYRIGQANTQLGRYEDARRYLERAEKASQGDESMVASVRKELQRLQDRKERHIRQRKRAFERMVAGDADKEPALRRTYLVALAIVAVVAVALALAPRVPLFN